MCGCVTGHAPGAGQCAASPLSWTIGKRWLSATVRAGSGVACSGAWLFQSVRDRQMPVWHAKSRAYFIRPASAAVRLTQFSSSRTFPGNAQDERYPAPLREIQLAAVFAREAIEEQARQDRNILDPLAQRRQQQQRHDIDAVVEIGAELVFATASSRLRLVAQTMHVDLHRLCAADALEFAFLQNAQELCLE